MEGSVRNAILTPAQRRVLEHIFVNMPWSSLPAHLNMVLDSGANIELGFGAAELDRVRTEDVAAATGILKKRGCRITAHGPFWDLCPGSIDRAIREASLARLAGFFDIVEVIRPEQIVCHLGYDHRHHDSRRSEYIDNSIECWSHFIKVAEKIEAPIVLENVWEKTPEIHREVLGRLDPNWIGFCLDTGHQHSYSKTPLNRWLDATADRLREIHIHDNDGSDDHHLPVGQGSVDFDFLFGFLHERGLRPTLTLEPHTEDHFYESLRTLSRMESFLKIL